MKKNDDSLSQNPKSYEYMPEDDYDISQMSTTD